MRWVHPECGGWDSNPRRTSPSGPKPDPFGHSGTPARLHIMKTVYNKNLIKKHHINPYGSKIPSTGNIHKEISTPPIQQ